MCRNSRVWCPTSTPPTRSIPRAGIVHEGAHYQQLSISFRHHRPLRRHYYDSGANEGIAFYNEELMLASGLFDDQPASRTIMYNFMRLRALRVEVDVRLALGELTSLLRPSIWRGRADGCRYRARGGGVLRRLSRSGASPIRLASPDPADVRRRRARRGRGFVVRDFHDRLWREGTCRSRCSAGSPRRRRRPGADRELARANSGALS